MPSFSSLSPECRPDLCQGFFRRATQRWGDLDRPAGGLSRSSQSTGEVFNEEKETGTARVGKLSPDTAEKKKVNVYSADNRNESILREMRQAPGARKKQQRAGERSRNYFGCLLSEGFGEGEGSRHRSGFVRAWGKESRGSNSSAGGTKCRVLYDGTSEGAQIQGYRKKPMKKPQKGRKRVTGT